MFLNRMGRRFFLTILLLVLLIPVIIFSAESVLAQKLYTRELQEFIKNDKEIRLLLSEKKNSIRITPYQDLKISNQKGEEIYLKKDTIYEFSHDYPLEKRWKLQVFATQNKNKAENIVAELKNKGYENITLLKKDNLYKVQLGDFSNREESESLSVKLARDGWDSWPISYEKISPEKEKKIIIYGPDDEIIFSGKKIRTNGSLKIDSTLYKGDFDFNFTSYGIEIFNDIAFNKLITAMLSAEVQGRARLSHSKYTEALKAQAIAIRTKILHHIIEADKTVYKPSEFKNFRGFTFYKSYVENAVEKTDGIVINYNNEIINSYYHKNSGGETASAINIIEKNIPYLKSVSDQRAIDDPLFLPDWSANYQEKELLTRFSQYFQKDINGIRDITIEKETSTNRVAKIKIKTDYGSYQIKGEEIREYFQIKSLIFEINKEYNNGYLKNLSLSGIGIGSGLGLSQDGAQIMAREGKTHKEIINYYYQNVSLKDLNFVNYTRQLVEAKITIGLKYKELRQINWSGPKVITVLEYEIGNKRVAFNNILANNKISGLADLSDIVNENQALAAVNGGFYQANGEPLGLFISNKKIISKSIYGRASLAQTEEGNFLIDRVEWEGMFRNKNNDQAFSVNLVNEKATEEDIAIYNHYFGKKAPLLEPGMTEFIIKNGEIVSKINSITIIKSEIPENGYIIQARKNENFSDFKVGDKVEFINYFNNSAWNKSEIVNAVGGGPLLVVDGEVAISGEKGKFQNDILYGRAPRTAVGITEDEKLVFFTVDGRQPELSVGITLKELAHFMKDYGIIKGMNLDGGASARMMVRGYTMSNPSSERLLSNGLIFYKIK